MVESPVVSYRKLAITANVQIELDWRMRASKERVVSVYRGDQEYSMMTCLRTHCASR